MIVLDVGEALVQAWAFVTRTPPSRERLLEYARRFARELHGIEPPEAALAERIEYVVWGRKQGWAQVEDGVMSEADLRQLLLDHFDYECADVSGQQWSQFDPAAQARFVESLDAVLFGGEQSGSGAR